MHKCYRILSDNVVRLKFIGYNRWDYTPANLQDLGHRRLENAISL